MTSQTEIKDDSTALTARLTDIVTVSKQAISCDLMGDVAVLDMSSGVYFGLEGVGCATWNFIQQPRTVAEIVDHLLKRYTVDRDLCMSQTMAFLDDLGRHGLIRIGDAIRP
jgi:hypothetical protein